MMRVTKKLVDELAQAKVALDAANKAAAAAKKAYTLALEPFLPYVDSKVTEAQGYELRGVTSVVEFGAKAKNRKLTAPVDALRLLEAKQEGLGYGLMEFSLSKLDEQLLPEQTVGLFRIEYGARSVKATLLPPPKGE